MTYDNNVARAKIKGDKEEERIYKAAEKTNNALSLSFASLFDRLQSFCLKF